MGVFLKDSIFATLALQTSAEMIRKVFGKNYRSQEIDFQIGEVSVSFEIQCFWRCWIDSTLPARKVQGSNRTGASSWPQPPKSRQPPGHRVLDAGGDLSSDSSEGHTDVARRDELRCTPGFIDSSGCLHAGSRRQTARGISKICDRRGEVGDFLGEVHGERFYGLGQMTKVV